MTFAVRTGLGTVKEKGQFTDTLQHVRRAVRQHSGWQSVRYAGKRFQLHGGIRTEAFICLNNPICKRSN